MPQPPSAASVRITQVRPAWVASPVSVATICVASLTSCFCPSRLSAPGGVITWMRTVRACADAAVCTADAGSRWM